jgi:hypothetical protein
LKRSHNKSSARDPFTACREVSINLIVSDNLFAGTLWDSLPASRFDVNWLAFLADTHPPIWHFAAAIETANKTADLPITSMLVGYAARVFEFLRQMAAAPTIDEVAARLELIRRTIAKLGSLAQGADGRRPISPAPAWYAFEGEDPKQRETESFIRAQSIRTPAFHTVLQHHIEMVYDQECQQLQDDAAWDEATGKLQGRYRDLVRFFDQLPQLIKDFEVAETKCAEMRGSWGPSRKSGAPGDPARNWILVRLMWIYRDVIGDETTIYARRTRARVQLSTPEPDGCMAFVVDAMDHIEPVPAHAISALEKKLIDLRPLIPLTRLASPLKRGTAKTQTEAQA